MSDDQSIVLNSVIVKQVMRGVFPTNKDIDAVNAKYSTCEDTKNTAMKVLQQDKDIIIKSSDNFISYQKKSESIADSLSTIANSIDTISLSVKQRKAEPLFAGVDSKISEFSRVTNQNNDRIKKLSEGIPEIQRKKKENDDFFKKLQTIW